MNIMDIKIRKPGRMPTKPLSLEPYLEILREQVTGNKKGSVRKYTRMKIKKLTENPHGKETAQTRKKGSAGIPGKPSPSGTG